MARLYKNKKNMEISSAILNYISRKYKLTSKLELEEFIEKSLMDHLGITLMSLVDEDKSVNFENFVYVYMDPRKGKKSGWHLYDDVYAYKKPFYIGKGRGNRHEQHLKYAQNSQMAFMLDSIEKDGEEPIIHIIKTGLSNLMAHNLENIIIANLRLQKTEICNLTNQTDPTKYGEVVLHTLNVEMHKAFHILGVLNTSKNIEEASSKLGISQRTLYRKMDSLKIQRSKDKSSNKKYIMLVE
jgi:hypothetical protein